jgi:uncharacterized secreted repeat protein (TIGR03808 family)
MFDRRRLMAAALTLPAVWSVRAALAQTAGDAAPSLQRAIDEAQRSGRPVMVPAGATPVSRLRITGDARLVGAGRASRLVALGPGPMLAIEGAESVSIENIAFDGAARAPGGEAGLIEARDVANLTLLDCAVERAQGCGVRLERCGGRVERSSFRALAQSALMSLDATGLTIADNSIDDCGANGLQIWRSAPGYDGSIVRDNRLRRIRADPGGDGPYGNAVSVFRADGVACRGNVIREAAFSAIRFNSSSDALIANNSCFDVGETAIYVEFAFEGAVVSSNMVDGASIGVSVTNFDRGGRLATVVGNVLRNLVRPLPQGGVNAGVGIHVEAATEVSGNAVDAATFAGLSLGYGVGLSDVVASDNILSDCGFGIAVSVAPGAGAATIRGNRIVRARRGAIVGMEWERVAVPDLMADATRRPLLTISGNEVR